VNVIELTAQKLLLGLRIRVQIKYLFNFRNNWLPATRACSSGLRHANLSLFIELEDYTTFKSGINLIRIVEPVARNLNEEKKYPG
jgi:hypothetical protein